jgi:NADPH:quinone reductase-like Zn-dependent oxidoreductase
MGASTMRAYVQRSHGGPDVCAFEDTAVPAPRAGEVLIKVEATGLNRLDILQRTAPLVRGFHLPHIAGMDIVGIVSALSSDTSERDSASGPSIGQRVIVDPVTTCRTCRMCTSGRQPYCPDLRAVGSTQLGGFAEYVVVPADRCWPVPGHLTVVEAAAVPVAYMTAWQALHRAGKVQAGETVVVNGANAGVSTAAIQLAKAAGATVIGTIRGRHRLADALAIGCDIAIDSADPSTVAEQIRDATGGEGADLIIDHIGPAQFAPSVDALAVEGRLVVCGTTTGTQVNLALTDVYWWGRHVIGAGGHRPADLGDMLAVLHHAQLRPVIDAVAPFSELPDLLDRMEHGEVMGKLVTTF